MFLTRITRFQRQVTFFNVGYIFHAFAYELEVFVIIVELQTYSKEKAAREFSDKYSYDLIESFSNSNKASSKIGKKTDRDRGKKDKKESKKNASVKNTDSNPSYRVVFSSAMIYLLDAGATKVYVDFVEGELAHRRKFGGGKGQMIAKAVGLNKGFVPTVLDATAGLGADAFVLASLGCNVTMIERSPVARLLLADGLDRAKNFVAISNSEHEGEAKESKDDLSAVIQRMTLVPGDSLNLLELEALGGLSINKPDVIYLDPMFPERKKTAQVKKGMKAFHNVIGEDVDADKLLEMAIALAEYRVVVKRPKIAPFLNDKKPMYQLLGKSSRFDIYTIKALPVGG